MPSLEYGDFYKFVVSLGVALIVFALLLPWAFLREPFDLGMAADQIAKLPAGSQWILTQRQALLGTIIQCIPWMSLLLLGLGITVAVGGLKRWNARQQQRDRSEDLSVKRQQKELESMEPKQVEARLEEEVVEDVRQLAPAQRLHSSASHVLGIERKFFARAAECLGSHEVLTNRKLGVAEFDGLLQSQIPNLNDTIVEMKYIKKGFHSGYLIEAAKQLAVSTQLYSLNFRRQANSVLIVVFAETVEFSNLIFEQMRDRALLNLTQRSISLRIEFVKEESIERLSCKELTKLLLG